MAQITYMVVIRLALALCILATIAAGCSHHGEALASNSETKSAHGRNLLTKTHADGTRIVRKCGVATTSASKKQSVQRKVQRHIEARSASNARARSVNVNVYVTVNRNGGNFPRTL